MEEQPSYVVCIMGAMLSKGLMTFAVYALNMHWVVRSVAENITDAYAQAANGTKSQICLAKAGPKLILSITTFHCNPRHRPPTTTELRPEKAEW